MAMNLETKEISKILALLCQQYNNDRKLLQ